VRCVFFGSPDFALGSLEALLASTHEVVGVITQPDRPSGRGLKMEPPPVKVAALARGLPIHQPEKVNCDETYSFLNALRPDVLCVVAYGGFLGAKLLTFCKTPPINVHPSLLPDLRGAAPVQWALLRGYRKTGITTQFMVKEMDAGDVLLQEEFTVDEQANAKQLLEQYSKEGGRMLVQTLDALEKNALKPKAQNAANATFAPLLTKEDGLVDFRACEAWKIHNQARGLYPWPGAYAFINNKRVKIIRTAMARKEQPLGAPGAYWMHEDRMFVACVSGVIEILELQLEGKRAMLPKEFESGMKESNSPRRFDSTGETAS